MKYYKFLLAIALLCCNVSNAQVQFKVKAQKSIRGVDNKNSPLGSYLYTIKNKTEQNQLIFFIEEDKETLPWVKLLKRKLFHRYDDFSFSMIEWEANMTIENNNIVTPGLFVKILAPKRKFTITVPFFNREDEDVASKVTQHLLVCPESAFSSNLIEMPHFMENLQSYDFAYPGNNVVIYANTLKLFILRKDE
jgi:hypothetical protein